MGFTLMRKTQESSRETIELAAKGIQTVDHGAMESQKFSLTKAGASPAVEQA
jgi:hypothetical protein